MGATSNTPSIVTDGLVFLIDAANVRSYPGSGTTVTDIGTTKIGGNLVNGVGFDGISFTFDGINDQIQFLTPLNSYPFCIGGAFNIEDITVNRTVISILRAADITKYFALRIDGGEFVEPGRVVVSRRNTTPQDLVTTSVLNTTDFYVCYVNFIDATTIEVILNGIQIYSNNSEPSVSIDSGFDTLALGTIRTTSPTSLFLGDISIGQVYNKAISTTEGKQNYEALKHRFE